MKNQIREIREAQLMSKAELARKAGVSPVTVDRPGPPEKGGQRDVRALWLRGSLKDG